MRFLSWRSGAVVAAVLAMVLAWRNSSLERRVRAARVAGGQGPAELAATAVAAEGRGAGSAHIDEGGDAEEDALAEEEPRAPRAHWAVELLRPRPGEDLFAYRDRVLPMAQAVVAPQRTRVANKRREVASAARLDARQEAELDAAVAEASDAVVNRVWQAVGTQEVWPRLRPAAAAALASDLLAAVVAADRRFRATLTAEQIAVLDERGFDVIDYLAFSVPWEERFGIAPASEEGP
ncbi:MAG TPA: hypothetical protein VMZ28_09635 [Kofleriaceae bacterium]|nr:hypothetical protein [Kofleriaceae bacterium]